MQQPEGPEPGNITKPKINKKLLMFDVLITLMCVGAVIYSGYTWNHLNEIKHECLDSCNDHWINELPRLKCPGYTGDGLPSMGLNYTLDWKPNEP